MVAKDIKAEVEKHTILVHCSEDKYRTQKHKTNTDNCYDANIE